MRIYLVSGLVVIALGIAGAVYYYHPVSVAPAPKDLTTVLPKRLLDAASPLQLDVLRGKAMSVSKSAVAAEKLAAKAPASQGVDASADAAGVEVALHNGEDGTLLGTAINRTDAAYEYHYPAGTLFSNGAGDVVLLKQIRVNVSPKSTVDLNLPVAQTSSSKGVLKGAFTPHEGAIEELTPLLNALGWKRDLSSSAIQTAVFIVTDDAPLDVIASFPHLRPPSLVKEAPKPFCATPSDLIAALSLVRDSGIDPATTALMGEPQLKVMTMLNPDSHDAAMSFFGVTEQTHWNYWKQQLVQGDPSLRHYALYGIARYYPEVALQMMPTWVRSLSLTRNYRISAAWALALIDDPRAQKELKNLRKEMSGDAGLRQTLDRALQHLEGKNGQLVESKA